MQIVNSLAWISDTVVENFRPGVLERMGLGYAAPREMNPSIIVAAFSVYGFGGPYSRYPGYASIFNATPRKLR